MITDHEPMILCYEQAAEALFTDEIRDLGRPWQEWIMYAGPALDKIFGLWPSWIGTLEEERHMIVADFTKKMRRGRS
ncbi:hypothetical protein [Sulfobacillus thermosulfidooxidans]|uniref:hypothetical protein n=1 Tax=Sulfobacillus thermosulfidooxidans TaxID=28034 RepID=UPI0006B65CF8|nr:hypothetical protein [Sulfobacillus thermosulfidooxidans]